LEGEKPLRARFNILLAEDNPADITLVRRALKSHGVDCELHVIQDGAEAIQWITNLDQAPNAPVLDMMLLDMHLPKHDGPEILRCLRSTENYAQTPVIVMTSQDSKAVAGQASRNAAMCYFRKPSSLDEFMELGAIVKTLLSSNTDCTEARDREKRSGARP
jgi:CheY-like chemotaxis protein